jgi:hypothetical protein
VQPKLPDLYDAGDGLRSCRQSNLNILDTNVKSQDYVLLKRTTHESSSEFLFTLMRAGY